MFHYMAISDSVLMKSTSPLPDSLDPAVDRTSRAAALTPLSFKLCKSSLKYELAGIFPFDFVSHHFPRRRKSQHSLSLPIFDIERSVGVFEFD